MLQLIASLEGHSDRAWAVAWNPTRPILASCSGDKTVRLYAFSPDWSGHLLHSQEADHAGAPPQPASKRRIAYRFNLLNTIQTGHSRTVRNIAWHPQGRSLATASFDTTVSIWEEIDQDAVNDESDGRAGGQLRDEEDEAVDKDWECVSTLEGHESEVKAVRWNSDGNLIATSGRDKSVWVWESTPSFDFECLAVLMDHSQDVKNIAWHPKEELLASASYDDTILMYAASEDDDEWLVCHTLRGHTSTVWSLAFSPDGDYLATVSDDRSLRIWHRTRITNTGLSSAFRVGRSEKEKWTCVKVIDEAHERCIYSVDWTATSSAATSGSKSLGILATGGGDGRIAIWRASSTGKGEETVCHVDLADSIEQAHGVSDVNAVSFCRFQPSKTRRRDASSDEDSDDEPQSDHDARWPGVHLLLASAGDDGSVHVYQCED
ncbi:uncharacterized protein L969DRAFT_19529 [Mixia osmundae IAM 14324]|uniref:Probable cytosolic iron-sulfur protein assembly protein 1 n=1 Tax=Mixia osmundae (strain CBS 9802 / IAM 14324 / JCM 22182 / KY 12970) TaxID=764103 RepID=G7DUP6_MIXOS|nr:uncharacterized protein L969DRAFT_19529 [Mixia osmundae IAM 14324]KEI37479.1 hypothetical protein L969DRAFT_19529 [Mixia osmundae IAM 14324]GAA94306.1 hypothetical protein E5Q_00955 [Mixia osmundae IAM 14324]